MGEAPLKKGEGVHFYQCGKNIKGKVGGVKKINVYSCMFLKNVFK